MSAEDHQFAYALNIKRSYNVLQNGLLGGITGVNTKRKLALSGVMRTERYGRHHHATHTGTFQCQRSGIYGNIMRKNTVCQIRQMQVMRLGSPPRKNDNIILHIFHFPITGNGKINFSFFHTTVFYIP